MRLPGAELADINAAKLTGYLLNPAHPEGGSKARFLLARGFRREEPHYLRAALLRHPLDNLVVSRRASAHGESFEVRCTLRTPDGRDPCIRTIWIIDAGAARPRLVTAYPI